MPNLKNNDSAMRDVLTSAKAIAVVGHSDKRDRASYQIAQFLRRVGYTVYPVNPMVKEIDGQPSYPSLKEVPEPVDIVNVFRRSEYLLRLANINALACNHVDFWLKLRFLSPFGDP